MIRFANVHERWLSAEPAAAGSLIDTLASSEDRLWPSPAWPQMRFDKALQEGARGGHGPIRYAIEGYLPGRLVSFRFDPATGFAGRHWIEVVPQGGGVSLRHVVEGHSHPIGWLYWAFAIRHLHDALIEDAFDRAERELTGAVRSPAPWSVWVRLLRWAFGSKVARGALPR